MKLHFSPSSPYVRKVMILLHETGQLDDVDLIPTSGTPMSPATGYATQNPLTKVPALQRPDGCTLYDSRVICRYLDDRGRAGLYGHGAAMWEVLTLEATAEGMLDAALLMVYEARLRPAETQSVEWVEGQWRKIDQALQALEARWIAHLNAPLNMGQIALACALGYLDLRHADRNWRLSAPQLRDWFRDFSTRPSFQLTEPAG